MDETFELDGHKLYRVVVEQVRFATVWVTADSLDEANALGVEAGEELLASDWEQISTDVWPEPSPEPPTEGAVVKTCTGEVFVWQ